MTQYAMRFTELSLYATLMVSTERERLRSLVILDDFVVPTLGQVSTW